MPPITLADWRMTNSSQCRCARTHWRHFNCRPTMMAKRYHCCDAGHSTSNLYKSILLYQGRQKHVGRVRRPLAWLARFSFYSRYKFHPLLVLNIKHRFPRAETPFFFFLLFTMLPLPLYDLGGGWPLRGTSVESILGLCTTRKQSVRHSGSSTTPVFTPAQEIGYYKRLLMDR